MSIVIIMKDIIAGGMVGFSQVGVGHPFDTAKVLIQNKKPWSGLPLSSYYKGWKFPLLSAAIFNSIVFPIYERTVDYTNNSFASGFIAGAIVSPVVYIFDVGKIRQQTLQTVNFRHLYTTYGKDSTLYRETLAMSLYFGSYFNLRKNDFHPLTAGGIAGLVNWTFTYPLDVIRSRQMAQNIPFRKALNQGNLWTGYSICAGRAVIVNAANFWVYETVKKYL